MWYCLNVIKTNISYEYFKFYTSTLSHCTAKFEYLYIILSSGEKIKEIFKKIRAKLYCAAIVFDCETNIILKGSKFSEELIEKAVHIRTYTIAYFAYTCRSKRASLVF